MLMVHFTSLLSVILRLIKHIYSASKLLVTQSIWLVPLGAANILGSTAIIWDINLKRLKQGLTPCKSEFDSFKEISYKYYLWNYGNAMF